MASANPSCIPIIDFSREVPKPGTSEWEFVKSQVRKAIEEYGCFQALCEKIPEELQQAFLNEVEELYDLSLETKMSAVTDNPFCTYYSTMPCESFHIFEPAITGNMKSFSDLLWPNGNPSFSNTMQSFSKQALELENIFRRMIVGSLGMEKYLDEHMNSTNHVLRLIKYQSPKSPETKLALESHLDQGVLGILYQNGVDGLEVQTRNGEWIPVKFSSPNTFMVIVGESFNVWANGRLPCVYHRVMLSGNKERYSAGWFSLFKSGYTVKAPEELVDEEHPSLFRPFDFFEFAEFFRTAEGKKNKYTVTGYCSV